MLTKKKNTIRERYKQRYHTRLVSKYPFPPPAPHNVIVLFVLLL